MAQAENKDLLKEEKSSSEETVLMNKKVGFVRNSSREYAKDESVLVLPSRGPKRWFKGKSNDLENSVGADKHCKDIR